MNFNLLHRLGFKSKPGLPETAPPGIHTFERQWEEGKARIHLRADPDGSGLLIINAARILHLNPTAVQMAWYYLNQSSDEEAIRRLNRLYRPATDITHDYHFLIKQIESVINPNGACPICDLGLDILPPFSDNPSAPYRMDLALTYRCNNDCHHCYNARPRSFPSLTTADWKKVLEKVWQAGIPHVVFTGGEPTLQDDLAELVEYANSLGMIAGINTNGRKLKDLSYIEPLVKAGLDHVQITLESHDPAIHDAMVHARGAWQETIQGIKNVLTFPNLYMMTNTTLLQSNSPFINDTLQLLADLGTPTIGLNALIYAGRGAVTNNGIPEENLPQLLTQAREFTRQSGQRLIWYTPTQYCHFDPLQLELGVKGCTAALYNMCVEPDGAVIPCQSYYEPLGNILQDPWEQIWNHPLAKSLRSRSHVPEACKPCELLRECGGGCPLAREHTTACKPIPVNLL